MLSLLDYSAEGIISIIYLKLQCKNQLELCHLIQFNLTSRKTLNVGLEMFSLICV